LPLLLLLKLFLLLLLLLPLLLLLEVLLVLALPGQDLVSDLLHDAAHPRVLPRKNQHLLSRHYTLHVAKEGKGRTFSALRIVQRVYCEGRA